MNRSKKIAYAVAVSLASGAVMVVVLWWGGGLSGQAAERTGWITAIAAVPLLVVVAAWVWALRPGTQAIEPMEVAPRRHAAQAGDTATMFSLALRLAERGDVAGAEQWYRRAAAVGHTGAMVARDNLLEERGKD